MSFGFLFKPSQHAYPSYFFSRGFVLLLRIFLATLQYARNGADTCFELASTSASKVLPPQKNKNSDDGFEKVLFFLLGAWHLSLFLGFGLAGLLQYAVGFCVALFFSFLHLCVLLIGVSCLGAVIAVLSLFHRCYSLYYRIFHRCPSCHEAMPIPVFLCPFCSAKHTRLWPSTYGVFYHRCLCGAFLPTLDLLGRSRLQRLCAAPNCRFPLHGSIGRATNIHIPIVGGAAAGKSTFIVQSTHQLLAHAALHDYRASFSDPRDQRDFQDSFQSMSQGVLLQKTIVQRPKAYTLLLQPPNGRVGKLLYLYDAAGEFFESTQALRSHTFHRYTHGILFLLDPFSIPSVARNFSTTLQTHRQAINPSQIDPEAVYTRLFHLLEASFHSPPFPISLAVVLPKIDACGLDAILGKDAARSKLSSEPSLKTLDNASHSLARDFLLQHQQHNLLHLMETHFTHVRYFPCSALGRLPQITQQGSPFLPQASFEPLLWLLQQQGVFPKIFDPQTR